MSKNVVREDVVKISYEIAGESKLQSLSEQVQKFGKGTADSVAKADENFRKLGNGAGSASEKISRSGKSAKDSLKSIGDGAGSASEKVKKLGGDAQSLSKKLASADKKLSSVSKGLNSAGNKLSLGVTAPIAAAATASVKMATDAATSYAKVQTIADSTKLSYAQLVNGVQKSSNETGIAVTDFNEALYQSLSAGVDSGKAIGFTNNMAKLAKGGFTSLNSAVDVVTSTLNAYGMSADQATNVSDKLITTQNIGKTTVDLLSSSLGMVIPTAKAFGVNLDTVCAGMADLTKNGIQTAEATTYMNAMFNELGKSGTVADKALRKATGESFTQLLGKGKSVTDVLAILQSSAKKSGKSLADMFGTAEGGKAALTIMKDGGTEFNSIVQKMGSSAGATQTAFNKMDATPAAKFNKELNKLKNQGIEVGTKLLPIVGKGLGYVDKLLDAMGKLSTGQQSFIMKMAGGAALLGPAMKGIAVPISGISKIVGAIGKNAAKKSAAKAIADTAAAAAPAAKKVGLLSKAGTALSGVFAAIPLPAKIALGVGAAAAVGIGLAIKHASDEAAKADLAKRFGNVTLSAKECEDAAKELSSTPWTFKLDAVTDAKSKIDGLKQSVQTASQELQKTEWKASMGLKLSDDDKTGFQQSADSLAENAVKYLEQKHYTANLAVSAVMMPGSTDYSQLTNLTDKFYSDQQAKAQEMGDSLKSTVSDALKDGVLSADEIGNIQGLQTSIQGAVNKASSEKYTASLKALQVNATAGGLTADSFKNLTTEIGKQTSASLGKADESLKVVISELDMQLANGAIDNNTYKNLVDSAQNSLNQRKADLQMKNYSITMEPLTGKYKDELSSASSKLNSGLSTDFLGGIISGNSMVKSAYSGISSKTQDGLKQMLAAAKPQTDEMEKTKQAWIDKGKIPPTAFMQSMQKTYELQAASKDFTHQFDLLAGKINSSSATRKVYESMAEAGEEIPKELSDALKSEYGLVYEAGKGLIPKAKPEPSMVDNVKSAMKQAGFDISDSLAKSINDKGTDVTKQVTDLMGTLNDGYGLKSGEIVALYSDLGLTIPKSLADGIAKGTPGAQRQMAQLVTDLEGGKQLNVDQIDSFFSGMKKTIPYAISHQLALAKNPVQKQLTQFLSDMYGGKSLNESDIKTMFHGLNVQTADGLARSLADKGPAAQMQVTKEVTALSQGVKLGSKDIESVFSSLNIKIPKGISDVVSNMKSASSQLTSVNLLGKLYSNAQLGASELKSLMSTVGIAAPSALATSLANSSPAVQQSVVGLLQSTQSGVQASSKQLNSLSSSVGINLSSDLVASLAQAKPKVQNGAAQLITTVGTATDAQRPALVAKMVRVGGDSAQKMLASMGMELSADNQLVYAAGAKAGQVVSTMDTKTASAILSAPSLANVLNSEEKANLAIQMMNGITSSSTITAPKMGDVTGAEGSAERAWSLMQATLNANPLHQTVIVESYLQNTKITRDTDGKHMKISAGYNAAGGVINHKILSWVGEEPGHPEIIIPTNPSRRSRALSLWQQAGAMLGIKPQAHADGGIVPSDDGTAYHPDYQVSGSKSYDDHSIYAPQFIATFGANTPNSRDMERVVKKWISESMQDALNSRDRRVPAEMIV